MVRVRFIGDRRRLDNKLVDLMDELELLTSENDLLHLTIALNYGGRDEVARATKRLAYDVQKGRLDPKTIDEETLPKYLDTYVLPCWHDKRAKNFHQSTFPCTIGSKESIQATIKG